MSSPRGRGREGGALSPALSLSKLEPEPRPDGEQLDVVVDGSVAGYEERLAEQRAVHRAAFDSASIDLNS